MYLTDALGGAPVVRPNPLQWVRYALIGSVPRRNRAWVLYDVTCRTWAARHAAHYLVLVAPFITAVMFFPTALPLRLEMAAAAGGSLFLGYMCFTTESLERRADKAGYPYGIAGQLREQRATAAQRASVARYRERRDARLYRR